MTKIYLVTFRDKQERIYDFEVFTNKKKALQYQRYWRAHSENTKTFKGDKIEIVEQNINNSDYTEWANMEEMKNLPY